MWPLARRRSAQPGKDASSPGFLRDRLAKLLAGVTVVCVAAAFLFAKDTRFLMPGPMTSAHGSIENCSSCHTKSGSGKLSWVHGLVAGDRLADSKACLTCHKMPDTAFNAHSASADVLDQSTKRLANLAAKTPWPQSARAQNAAFPAHDVVARGLFCSTCHQEHQGVNFNLNKISNEQCRSCHEVKFDSFDGRHPKFENYPFKRRTRIIYDHAGHFGKHFPEVAKKEPSKRIPETCSNCHNSNADKRVMAVAPFDQTCTGCHLGQITGKDRATGPKGIAFLSLPGLDLQTLQKKNAAIGEWPDASDAKLTPFMKVMIGRDEKGRALLKSVDKLNLQDLSTASDDQIKAVTNLVWEVKKLFFALLTGKASDILGNLNIGDGAKLSATLVSDLTAGIPRDAITGAQQEWLPNLGKEMADRPIKTDGKQSSLGPDSGSAAAAPDNKTQPASAVQGAAEKNETATVKPEVSKTARSADDLPPPMRAGVGDPEKSSKSKADVTDFSKAKSEGGGEEEISVDDHGGETAKGRSVLPSGTPRSIDARTKKKSQPEAGRKSGSANKEDASKEAPASSEPPRTNEGAGKDASKDASPTDATKTDAATSTASEAPSAQPPSNPADQSDDLLFPTDDELRSIKAGNKDAAKTAQPEEAPANSDTADAQSNGAASAEAAKTGAKVPAETPATSGSTIAKPQARVTPVISIESDVDPESWAEYGGWYRQDYTIFYRPTGHKDKFIYSWLFLTGPKAPKGDASATGAVFAALTGKEAQGSCTKCHSIDDIQGKGRLVNFSPPSVESKQGRFTKFIHEPHFGIMENRGCLTCHSLEKDRPYLKSYEQGNPQEFASNFGDVKKDLCKTCHTSTMARQDCLLCHSYHVNGVVTPIMATKIPVQ